MGLEAENGPRIARGASPVPSGPSSYGIVEISSASSTSSHVLDSEESKKKGEYAVNIDSCDSFDSEGLEEFDSAGPNPFRDPVVAAYYTDLYEKCQYECRSRFDPEFVWSKTEEEQLLRKLDWRVTVTACILFVGLQVDRGNLGQAVADNLLDDLGMSTNEYNRGNSIFLLFFLLSEVPSQLISKYLGPDIFIPLQMCLWSLAAISQAFMTGKYTFYLTRALIGLLEGGFVADLVLWLSYFFKAKELPIRLSYFWTSLSVTQIFTSLLAFGLLRMRGVCGLAGWRWLFMIEGSFTFFVGLYAFYAMVPSAVQTKSRFHPNGWFTEREEKIVVNRVLRDDPSKGDMNNRQPLSLSMVWKSFCDYDLWPIYAIGFLAYIPTKSLELYMTLMMKNMGFSTFDVNLLSIPQYLLHIVGLLYITKLSERLNERSFVCLLAPLFLIPFLALLRWWPGSMVLPWQTWFLVTMVLATPYVHAICVAWVSRNSNSIRSRTICSAIYNMITQCGSIFASNLYREDDLPLYRRGNGQLFYLAVLVIPLLLSVKMYYVWRNKQRDEVWNSMTPDERDYYVRHTTDEGNKRLDFRFDH